MPSDTPRYGSDDGVVGSSGGRWAPAPVELAAPSGDIHIYCFGIDVQAAALAVLARLLAPDERTRARRFRFARDAARYTASRAGLRIILGSCIRQSPDTVRFVYGAQGKPALAGNARVQFSLSRSGAVALLALHDRAEIGADVEQLRPFPDALGTAARFFARDEFLALRSLPETDRIDAFFRYWTRKEAVIKSLGLGLSQPLNSFSLHRHDTRSAQTVTVNDTTRCVMPVPDPRAGHVAALATAGTVCPMRFWTWALPA